MRAAILTAYRADLSIETVPDPVCPPDGVVLRVLACGVCRSDWHGWVGEHPKVNPGAIPGHEYCGEVVEAAPGTGFRPGERVIAPFILSCGTCPDCRQGLSTVCADQKVPGFGMAGAFAEFIAVPRAHNLARLPEGMAPVLAAGLGCRVTTAWHALTGRADLRPGEWLAIHGTGGIGLSALLLGRALGARVVVVDVVPEKLTHALRLGAEAAFDAREGDVAARIREVTGGGAHVAIEALGIEATVNDGIGGLRPLGRHVQVGLPTGHTARMTVDMNAVYMKQLAVFGTRGMPAWKYPSLLDLIARGVVDLSPLVARTVPLSGASAELRAFDGPMPPGVAVIDDLTR